MYFYNIGYENHYEDWNSIELAHKEKYTDEELENIILKAVEKTIINTLDKYCQNYSKRMLFCAFDYIYSDIADILCENHGFEQIEYAAEYQIKTNHQNLLKPPKVHDSDPKAKRLSELISPIYKTFYEEKQSQKRQKLPSPIAKSG
jgi:hypothetical protein